ncbi:MAG: hypothetical protein V3U31_08535 [Dehalococcoidia bacterium]
MNWANLTLIIPVGRYLKRLLGVTARERRTLAREQVVVAKEQQLGELIAIREQNEQNIVNLLRLEAQDVQCSLGTRAQAAEIHFMVRNHSIFDVVLHKFIVKLLFQNDPIGTLSDVEEHKISKQGASAFTLRQALQPSVVEEIRQRHERHDRASWSFDMHAYFRSPVGDFERVDKGTLTTHP